MTRNFSNFFVVSFILLVLTACVCQSDRDNQPFFETSNTQNTSSDNTGGNKDGDSKKVNDQKKGDKKYENDKGDFIVEHVKIKNKEYEEVDKKIRENKTLEKAAVKLNNALILPKDITLRAKDCGEENAFYDPNDSSVTVCYELMEYFFKLFRSNGKTEEEANEKMFDAVQFVFLHEIGHALIDVYELPVMGNEEDAADRCSSYINLEELGEDGVRAVIAAADAFRLDAKGKVPTKRNLADEHLLQEQRFYNSLCMIYGSNVRKYGNLVDDGYLPEERAVKCPGEYEKTVASWVKLLEPWRKK